MVVRRLLSLALVAVLSWGDVLAFVPQSPIPEIENARRAYWEGRFAEAVEQLKPLLGGLDHDGDLHDAAFLLGLSYFALGDEARCREYFAVAAEHAPPYLPSAPLYPPDVVRIYTEVRSGRVGRLTVTSVPQGARIYVGEEETGETPFEGYVSAGEHSIKVELRGYTGQVRRVRIAPGGSTSVAFDLNLTSPVDEESSGPEEFEKIKILVREGEDAKEMNALLLLYRDRMVIRAEEDGKELKTFGYHDIRSAEYTYSKHPRWKEGLGAAVAVGVFAAPIFFLKGKKHWLTVETENDYAVLRLDKSNYEPVCLSFTARSGIDIELLGEK